MECEDRRRARRGGKGLRDSEEGNQEVGRREKRTRRGESQDNANETLDARPCNSVSWHSCVVARIETRRERKIAMIVRTEAEEGSAEGAQNDCSSSPFENGPAR